MSKIGVNWNDFGVLSKTGINWNDMYTLSPIRELIGMILGC